MSTYKICSIVLVASCISAPAHSGTFTNEITYQDGWFLEDGTVSFILLYSCGQVAYENAEPANGFLVDLLKGL